MARVYTRSGHPQITLFALFLILFQKIMKSGFERAKKSMEIVLAMHYSRSWRAGLSSAQVEQQDKTECFTGEHQCY